MPFICFCLSVVAASAQSDCHYTLHGKVVEAKTNTPVPYVGVLVRDLAIGTTTDENGNFSIKKLCRQSYILDFSHVECQKHTESVIIDGNTEGVFQLQHDNKLLQNVVIKAKKVDLASTQAQATLAGSDLDKTKGAALGEILKSLSGVMSLNTGATISKPVIQGLHSDRVLIVNNGVRHEGQGWGLDHAPEIDPFIAHSIAVVKGAAGVKYGVGAIGGVILVEPRPLRDTLGVGGEVNMLANSNGRLGILSTMIDGKNNLFSWRLQGTAKKSGTLKTPQYILDNTGLEEFNGSTMLGFRLKKAKFDVFYSHFYSKIGIFKGSHIGNLTDLKNAIEGRQPATDAPFTYTINRPAQRVNHDILKVKTTLPTGEYGELSLNSFFQYDLREEFDAHLPGGKIPTGFSKPEVAFQLPSAGLRADWTHRPFKNWQGGGGFEVNFQSNNTYAGALIPDYQQHTEGVYWTERWRKYPKPLEFEAGIRYDERHLSVDSTRFGESNRRFAFKNTSANIGAIYHIGTKGKVSFNVGTAWRNPNVNELFSNGVHHGTASFERGNPDLMPEKALSTNLSWHYDHAFFEVEATIFQNNISNFIFQKPDSTPVLTIRGAFPSFSYAQTDALLRGGDVTIQAHLCKNLVLKTKGSLLFARNKTRDEWLPLMPADRLSAELTIDYQSFKYLKNAYASIGFSAVRQQTRTPLSISDYQAPPKGYGLVGLSFGGDVLLKKHHFQAILTVDNLLNQVYRDYLDRMRYFSDAVGRNISLKLKSNF
ncbi:MAG: TonB-dependent receptor [Saprospiraceae bacterium]|nr:TonB-dependent receptor [Saprospiraceae bacterium]